MTQSVAVGNATAAAILSLFLLAGSASSSQASSLTPYESRTEFLLTSPASTSSGLYGYVNPALLAYVDAMETTFSWTDESGGPTPVNDWGVFSAVPHMGFGVLHRELEGVGGFNDYRLAVASGDRNASAGFAYGWSSGGDRAGAPASVLVLGTLLRPSPRISLGLTWTSTPSLDAREGVADLALRPLGTDRLTLFSDIAMASDRAGGGTVWSAGAALSPWPGFQLAARYLDSRTLSFGLNLDLGHLGFHSQSRYNRGTSAAGRRDRTRNLYSLRLGGRRLDGLSFLHRKQPAYVDLELAGALRHRRFPLFDSSHSLLEILTLIQRAELDPRVGGIAINLSGIQLSHEKAWELRRRLEEFRQSGKGVVVYLDRVRLKGYHLASVADRVVMDPAGMIALEGLVAGSTYLKGALDRIGIGVEEWRFYKYKSALETIARDGMSDADREQWQTLVDDTYGLARDDIISSRGLSAQVFDRLVDDVTLFLPEDAIEHGLVDTLARWPAMDEGVVSLEGSGRPRLKPAALTPPAEDSWSEPPRIAVIYALGVCAMDSGINARRLVGDIRRVARDDRVRAVVLRVDSPGGDVLPSDLVAEALQECREEKPVVVSQGSVAASGGYWISLNSDAIVAAPNTITGSIGVIGGWIYNKGIKEKLGLTTDHVQAGRHADLGFGMSLPFLPGMLPDRPLDQAERQTMERTIRGMYGSFVQKVAAARGRTEAGIDSVAQGRVWSGIRARDAGLIDQLGGLDTAVRLAREKAGIGGEDRVRIVEYPRMAWFNPSAIRGMVWPSLFATSPVRPNGSGAILEEFQFRLDHNGHPLLMLPMNHLGGDLVDP